MAVDAVQVVQVGRPDELAQQRSIIGLAQAFQFAYQLVYGFLALVVEAQQRGLLLGAEVVVAVRLALQFRPPFAQAILAVAGGGKQMSDARRKMPDDDRHGLFEHPQVVLGGAGVAGDPLHVDILKRLGSRSCR
ncbi:hypothetical protein D3C81_1037030 [compost metagenome]